MVGAGIHINAIGGDCPGKTELHRDILARARTFVEFEPQTRIEGEIQQMGADYPVTEFWQVLRGDADGRDDASQITLFDSVGFAIEDFSALRYIHAKIEGSDFFQPIDMLADPRSEEHTSELQSLMRTSYAVFCLKKKNIQHSTHD